jgi:hypothetical protein
LDVLFANYEENYGISFIWIIEDISIWHNYSHVYNDSGKFINKII